MGKQDYLLADDIDEVMRAMGFRPTAEELAELIEEIDEDGSGAIEFPEFAQLCAKFLVEDPDPETMRAELKQAFRLFDKEATGFITMDTFRSILAEVDPNLTEEDLDGIIHHGPVQIHRGGGRSQPDRGGPGRDYSPWPSSDPSWRRSIPT